MDHMKTTVELPDDLLIAAKQRAAELRKPLRRLIEEGLRIVLGGATARSRAPRPRIRWRTVPGGLPADLDLSDRTSMTDWIRRSR
jgi:hypothetical protein